MSSPQLSRILAALSVMIDGKLLFKQEENMNLITDRAIFRVPGSSEYCVLTILSNKEPRQVVRIDCSFPQAQALLRDLADGGKFQDFQEASINCPDAQRVLSMFQHYMIINNLRHENIRLPASDLEESGSNNLSVDYA